MSWVLKNVTNLPEKRRSAVTLSMGSKSCKENGNNSDMSNEGSTPATKRVCLEIENVPAAAGDLPKGTNAAPLVEKDTCDSCSSYNNAEIKFSHNGGAALSNDVVGAAGNAADAADVSGDSCGSSGPVPVACWKACDDDGDASDGNILTAVDLRKVGRTSVLSSLGTKSFGLNRCNTHQYTGNEDADLDALKSCSCSVCIKVAYILSDLYYQDLRGKITVLKKSQKEANILANKYAKEKLSDDQSFSKLESELTEQWKSLFHRMDEVFAQELVQQQSKFMEAKSLKDDCKTELDRVKGLSLN